MSPPEDAPPPQRFTSPSAVEWIGRKIPCLDHGFIYLVDVMGGDPSIVQAARVSYGLGTKSVSEDRGLIRYLMRHQHTTPFEMVELKFHVKLPIFVARQWIRHRTACLAGATELIFDLPGALRRRRRQCHRMTIEKFHRLWHEGVPIGDRLGRMRLRMCNEATGEIEHTTVTDVWQNGVKPVFRVTLQNGKAITMTKDHRCLTDRGWMTLEQATQLRQNGDGGIVWNGNAPALAVNGVAAYRDPNWLKRQRSSGLDVSQIAARAGTSYRTIRKYLSRFGLQYSRKERSRLSGLAQRGQRRSFARPRVYTEEHRRLIREARSGARSNFWKGGVTGDRANIARWTKEQAPRVHARFGYRCALCGGTERLHAHHMDPVWNNVERARDPENLISLCRCCHNSLHRKNLELELLRAHREGAPLADFWSGQTPLPRPASKPRPRVTRLVRSFSRIARIQFGGREMTYDLSVAGPYHNFVANGVIVHNSVNEYSGRYSVMPDEFYLPPAEQVTAQSIVNRQGGGETVPPERTAEVLDLLAREQRLVRDGYERLLGWDIRRELARVNLGVAQYTEWYWKNDLHNIFHFLQLRLDPHAQYEIRVYAEAMATIVRAVAPLAWEAFEDYQLHAERLSRLELEALARLVGDPDEQHVAAALPAAWRETGPGGAPKRNRERDEFLAKLRRLTSQRR